MDESTQRELAVHLALLRKEKRAQSGLEPRLVPPDKATAYRVAALVAEELGWKVGGWKIAAMKEAMQRALRTEFNILHATVQIETVPCGDDRGAPSR